jgi:hypothetical protein
MSREEKTMAQYLKNGLSAIRKMVRKCAACIGPWIQESLVEAGRVLRHFLQELREFSQRVLADLIRHWRGQAGF